MRKRLTSGILFLVLLLALAVPARADILWEPRDNPFFMSHIHGCVYENRSYYANGQEGFVTLWDAPGGEVVRAQYENGEKLWVGYSYDGWALICLDGVRWDEKISGWTPLSDLYLVYDHISFAEEYGDQFRDYNGEFAEYDGEAGETFCYWEYPYAGEPKYTVSIHPKTLDELRGKSEALGEVISKVYTDTNGRDWGYIEWLYDLRNVWLLLDDPTCKEIMSSCIPEADSLIASGEIVQPSKPVMPEPSAQSYAPYILTAGVVIVTACLLRIFWKKKK